MATVTFRLSPYKRKDGKQQIQMWVYADESEKAQDTGIKVASKYWDKKRSRVRIAHPNYIEFNEKLDGLERAAEKVFLKVRSHLTGATAAKIVEDVFITTDFHQFLDDLISKMTGPTQYSARSSHLGLQKILKAFRPVLALEDITTDFLEAFEAHLRTRPGRNGKPQADSSINKRMVQLKAVYEKHKNRAHPSPFEFYQMPSADKLEDYIPLSEAEVELIWNAEPKTRMEAEGKDIFLFSYYAAGMRAGDVISLEWNEIQGNEIVYLESKKEHHKKKRLVHVDINSRLAAILARRDRNHTTVFGILGTSGAKDTRREIINALSGRRKDFQMLCARVGITKWVSFKLARTSFAVIAEEKSDWNLNSVRIALNHSTTRMTENYTGRNVKAAKEVQAAVYGTVPEKQKPDAGSTTPPALEIRRYKSE